MIRSPFIAVLAGALVLLALAIVGAGITGPRLAATLTERAQAAIDKAGGSPVRTDFAIGGWPTRHPVLRGGEKLEEKTRARVAQAVAQVPGIGAIRWSDGGRNAAGESDETTSPLHCQDDVEALLRSRTVRFEEDSTRIDVASGELIDEVARALRPCLGGIIAITGHTDASGPEPGNIALSSERAESVRQALIRRGIPADGLRARGVGSAAPVEGLDPNDEANRRIEFSVITKVPIRPTAVDTPGPR
jgi:OOP family OmpA-OmpF porin